MRFVFAIICFVLAALMMGLGIGQRTIFAGPDEVIVSTTETTTSPVVVIDGSALTAYPQGQTVRVGGTPTIAAAYGSTDDVMGWVGEATYTLVTYNEETRSLESTVKTGTENEVPPLAGSDLWLHEYTGEETLRFRSNLPSDVSVILTSDGITPAPSDISIRWPLDNSTPWSGPLIAAGGVVLLLGLGLLIWALTHLRRGRGPRRTQQKLPKMPKLPRPPRYKPSKAKAIDGPAKPGAKGRRTTRRVVAVIPMVLVGSLLLAGCSIGSWPTSSGSVGATPTPTAATDALEVLEPAVSKSQVETIMSEVGTVVAQADATRDNDLIATRLAGPALELRLANYKIATADATLADVPTPIPPTVLQLTLPQQTDSWPRSIFAIVQAPVDATAAEADTETIAPTAVMLVQNDPRSNYKVYYAVTLVPGTQFPEVASADVGSAPYSPDAKLLMMAPNAVAGAYADILMKDSASPYFADFQADNDGLRIVVGVEGQQKKVAELEDTAEESFTRTAGTADIIALSTADTGAIVAVQVNETDTVKPVKSGASAKASPGQQTLLGKEDSETGIVSTNSDQLLFYVPPADSGAQIVLLGYANTLISVEELP